MFKFAGDMILSKSWLNRAQVIFHYAHEKFPFESDAGDVRFLQNAISSVGTAGEYNLGLGGTSFRFFIFLISRIPGKWKIFAEPQLLSRPQTPLIEVLQKLGISVKISGHFFEVEGSGWKPASSVVCDAGLSSQFVSGLLLNCWELESDLTVKVPKPVKSENYLKMTFSILQKAGMKIQVRELESELLFTVEKNQIPEASNLAPEADVSSAFSLAAAAVVDGAIEIQNWPENSMQPDIVFLDAFKKMDIAYKIEKNSLTVLKQDDWNGCEMDVSDSPDLFPVLCALCGLANGKSKIFGADHLKHKESNRLVKTAELLKLCGVRFEELSDGLVIFGKSFKDKSSHTEFDPAHDHRMAMAAGIFNLAGFNIRISDKDCVQKSYPAFWSDIGL